MSDVRLLLKEKADIETAMQRALSPHIRAFAQQQLDAVCKEIEEAREEFGKLFEPQEIDQLRARVKELEASNAELLEALEGMLELRPDDCSSQIYKIRQKAEKAIQKARGQG